MNTNNSKNAKVPAFIIPEEMKNINLSKESLMPMEQGTDFISLMQKFKEILNNKDSDWTLKIAVINYLRRIYKYEKQIFSQFFYGAKLYQKIIELIDSVRSSLSKCFNFTLRNIFRRNASRRRQIQYKFIDHCYQSNYPPFDFNNQFKKYFY